MMVIMGQIDVEDCDPNFHPEFLVGDPEVLDPYTGALISSYGITDEESDSRIHQVYTLWSRLSGISGGNRVIEAPG